MITASCHCGAVQLDVVAIPSEVTDCNCSICRRYGVLWAYFDPKDVVVRGGATDTYMWDDRAIAFHRCSNCGCVSHWSAIDPSAEQMGINARLFEPAILETARVRHLDGAVTETYVD
jgi:hypothetical protein